MTSTIHDVSPKVYQGTFDCFKLCDWEEFWKEKGNCKRQPLAHCTWVGSPKFTSADLWARQDWSPETSPYNQKSKFKKSSQDTNFHQNILTWNKNSRKENFEKEDCYSVCLCRGLMDISEGPHLALIQKKCWNFVFKQILEDFEGAFQKKSSKYENFD